MVAARALPAPLESRPEGVSGTGRLTLVSPSSRQRTDRLRSIAMSRHLLLTGATACCLLATAAPATAAPPAVTTTADSGAGSLRAALAAAGVGDTVTVPAGSYVLTTGALTVPAGVTVTGAGARATVLDGNHVSGVLSLSGAGSTITDLKVTGGKAASGAGIFANAGVTVRRVAVVGNAATGAGGGIYSGGAQPLLVDHSLIANNQAGNGGGLQVDASVGGSSIVDTTITANVLTAAGSGGGFNSSAVNLLLDGDTIVGNQNAGGQGGNFRLSGGRPASIRNTVLATGLAGSGNNCYLSASSVLTTLGHNAQDTDPNPDSDCQNSFGPTDRKNLVLQLGPLQDNGGQLDTLLPAAASPLVDTGDSAACAAVDVRGVVRPQGAACDVGAVERSVPVFGSPFADTLGLTTATLHGTADTQGLAGTVRFAYGPTAAYGAFTPATPVTATTGAQAATAALSGLTAATGYHFRVEVSTADGLAAGPDATFTTAAPAPVPTPGGGGGTPAAPTLKATGFKRTKTGVSAVLTCTGTAGQSCRGTLSLRTVERLKGSRLIALSAAATRTKAVTTGQRTYAVAAGRSTTVTVGLNATGKRLLARFGRLPLRLRVTLKDSAGKLAVVSTSAKLTLKAPKR